MALYVVPVEQPAPGEDWQVVVPGQYVWNVTGITARLTTGGAPGFPNCPDVSGNGNDATYTAGGSTFVAGLVPGNDAMQRNAGNGNQINGTHPIVDVSSAFTYIQWVQFDAVGPSDLFLGGYGDSVVNHVGWQLHIALGFPHRFFVSGSRNMAGNAALWESVNNVVPYDSAPHMIAVTFDPAATPQNTLYLDGVVIPWQFNDLPLVFNGPAAGWSFNIQYSPKVTDEIAIVPGVLTAGQLLALHAAGAAFAGYNAAIMALSPFVYYHLDGLGAPGIGRQVDLTVAAGVELVAEIPSGFAAPIDAGPFDYSWNPTLRSSTQTPTSDVISVAIPRLVLPAGYTIGTRTLDIQSDDQWSDVTVWWDSDVMDSTIGAQLYAYPPGALLAWRGHRE